MKIALQEGLLRKFKLTTTISTSNMHLFDAKGIIQKYDSPEQILEAFFHIRLEFYVKRKKVSLENLQLDLLKLENRVRFILGVVRGEIIVNNRKRADLLLELKNKGFTPFPKKTKAVEAAIAGATVEIDETPEDNTEATKGVRAGDYEYLLSMAIGTLTLEKVQQLCGERDKLEEEVEELKKATPESLWYKDLDAFLRELDAQDLQEAKEEEYELSNMGSDAARIFRQVGKNTRKNSKKPVAVEKPDSHSSTNSEELSVTASTTVTEMEKNSETMKPKQGRKNATVKKQMYVESDEDDEVVVSLRDRLVAYNKGSLIDESAVEDHGNKQSSPTEDPKLKQREPARRSTKAAPVYVEMSDDDGEKLRPIPEDKEEEELPKKAAAVTNGKKTANGRGRKAMVVSDSDPDFGMQEDSESDYEAAIRKKGGRKPAAKKLTKASKTNSDSKIATAVSVPAAKKKGPKRPPQGQKLIDKMLQPAVDVNAVMQTTPGRKSPQKKVRKMRPSPFHKKSGSFMPKITEKEVDEKSPPSAAGASAGSSFSPEVNKAPKPAGRNRPQRSSRAPVQYVLSESEEEEDEATDDSNFEEDGE